MQFTLFPLDVMRVEPPLQGADLFGIGIALDGLPYYLKHPDKPNLPLTEWVCNQVAHAVGLPTTSVSQLKLRDGIVVFGSRAEASAYSIPDNAKSRMAMVPKLIPSVSNPQIYSACFVFDLFFSNTDRHWGNLLYQQLNNQLVIRVIDFSRSFPATPLLPIDAIANSTTVKVYKAISNITGVNRSIANDIIEKICKIDATTFESFIDSAHESWVNQDNKNALMQFWEDKDKRLLQIKEYLNHELL